jgi:hypothetical protein
MANLSGHADLARALGHGYDTFEAIRQVARSCEDQSPDLFAAFMSAAGAAADGRDAILTAISRPSRTTGAAEPGQPSPGASRGDVTDWIAASAIRLAARLDHASGLAEARQDRDACRDAAAAARQIHHLMAADHDDADTR